MTGAGCFAIEGRIVHDHEVSVGRALNVGFVERETFTLTHPNIGDRVFWSAVGLVGFISTAVSRDEDIGIGQPGGRRSSRCDGQAGGQYAAKLWGNSAKK